ncbi:MULTISPECIES: histone deacetylase family protein [Methanoculleus]|uniref:Histone deacetylase superfamily n=2 Tax=Methanoculleus TaxID=45989 RepID=A3CT27_METMJ|nr:MULTISPECIES: histone deacetylase [Methanoculleus]ABN56527.1 histone deacetylase superfamily [Methanoculleus marisnigri JR1]MCC7556925.1 histone deacetylase [Methanoculleus marisnigri]UYU17966.1 histone deacetylase [Methanoculleus submarinus]
MPYSVVTGDLFSAHDAPGHPESQARLDAALAGVPADARRIAPERATVDDLALVHTERHIEGVRSFCRECPPGRARYLDPDTYVTAGSFDAALYATGAAWQAVERALDGEHSFALVRPPGHHAAPDRAMGFCLFNNVAVATAKALLSIGRVAVVDWDLHHGNGTEEAFYTSDRVFYCSVHQAGIFPGTGWPEERGAGPGAGYTVNVPLVSGSTGADYALVFSRVFVPMLRWFEPDVVVVSAGQDALFDDPLGSLLLLPEDFGALAGMLVDATPAPLALVLEGGYGRSHAGAIGAIVAALDGARFNPAGGGAKASTRHLVEAYAGRRHAVPL